MNESILRRFCESPRRGLIVTIVTGLFGLVVMIPLADDYFDSRENRADLEAKLLVAEQSQQALPKLEEKTQEIEAQLSAREAQCVTEASLSDYRTRLVDTIRDAGCRIQRLDLAQAMSRPWNEADTPLVERPRSDKNAKATPYNLEKRTLSLSVAGRVTDILGLLEKLEHEPTLAYPQSLEFLATDNSSDVVTLNMQMWLFSLERKKL
jgi:hypothetical protein